MIKIAADLSKKELVLKETVAGKSSGIVRESDFPLTLKRVG